MTPARLCLYGPADLDGRHAWKGSEEILGKIPRPYDVCGPRPPYTASANGNPYTREIEGIYSTVHHQGWTFVAWWDRSGDGRHNCWINLAYPDETIPTETLFELARQRWPQLFTRLPYMLVPHETWLLTPKCSFCGGIPRAQTAPRGVGGICTACALRAASPALERLLDALLRDGIPPLPAPAERRAFLQALLDALCADETKGPRPRSHTND